MANLFSFLLPLCAFVNLGLLIFLSDSSGPLHLLSLCGQEKNNYYTRPRFNRGKWLPIYPKSIFNFNVLRMKSHCNHNSETSSESLALVFMADMQN